MSDETYDAAKADPVAALVLAALHKQDARTYNMNAGDIGLLALETAAEIRKQRSEQLVLVIDPRRQFGDVTVPSTRVPVSSIVGCISGGDTVERVAHDYGITHGQTLLCCWYFTDELTRKPWSRLNRHEKRVLDAWRDWAADAFKVFAHWDKTRTVDDLTDPPKVKD